MNLNEFAKEVHQNAVAHGWWGEEYTDAVVIALIQSEITEAFEEWRADRPMLWHRCKSNAPAEMVVCERCAKCYYREKGSVTDCPDYDAKPEGIAVELIDVVLRILDSAAAWGVNLKQWNLGSHVEQFTVPKLICELHSNVAHIYHRRKVDVSSKADANSEAFETSVAYPLILIFTWLRAHDIDPEALMREKHEYNKTRPYKHGGKRV